MIYDTNSIDIIGERKDGGLDFIIISTGVMDISSATQTLLLDKVQNYLGYIKGNKFLIDFPNISEDNIWIKLKFSEKPPQLIEELCEKIKIWVEEYGIKFITYIGK